LLRQQHYYRLYGFVLGLGEYTLEQLPAQPREALVVQLAEMYGSHPSRAVHSALGWLLRRWGQDELVRRVDETPLAYDESGVREWYVMKIDPPREDSAGNVESDAAMGEEAVEAAPKPLIDLSAPIYFTMIVFPGGEFDMGESRETRKVKVAGPIAVSDREVTWRQFSPIDGDIHRQSRNRHFRKQLLDRQLQPDEPVIGVNWFEAVNYCRWLTAAAGMDESAQSYQQIEFPRGAQSRPGWLDLPIATEWPMRLDRAGFRLLTEAEWEYVARADSATEYSFGDSESLLGEYCWCQTNSGGWSHGTGLLRPSVGGLYDIHGNLFEWTNDWLIKGSDRALGGGCWNDVAAVCRSAYRFSSTPSSSNSFFGFRLARSPSTQVPAEPESGDE